jgi:hypothetical protein
MFLDVPLLKTESSSGAKRCYREFGQQHSPPTELREPYDCRWYKHSAPPELKPLREVSDPVFICSVAFAVDSGKNLGVANDCGPTNR